MLRYRADSQGNIIEVTAAELRAASTDEDRATAAKNAYGKLTPAERAALRKIGAPLVDANRNIGEVTLVQIIAAVAMWLEEQDERAA